MKRQETPLTDDEIDMLSRDNLRAAYRTLRAQHIKAMIALVIRIDRMRPVYDRAIDWRQQVLSMPAQLPIPSARLIAAIDAAQHAEDIDARIAVDLADAHVDRVARQLFRAFDDASEGKEPLHDFDVMAQCHYEGQPVIDNWRALAREAIKLGAIVFEETKDL